MTRVRASRSGGHARIVDVDIAAINAAGDGVTADGTPLAVPFTIPGERVRVRVDRRRDHLVATLLEVLRPSPHRVAPRCRHFGPTAHAGQGACGGCNWQHIAYSEQLRLKTALLDDLVHAVVSDAPAARSTIPSTPLDSPWGYRNKVHFVFGTVGGTLAMGHYVRGSRRVLPVVECPVHDERGNAFAFAARDTLASAGALADNGRGTLRSLAVRVGCRTRELMATLVVSSDRDRRVRAATRRVIEQMSPTSMHVNVHARADAYIFGPSTRQLAGTARMREEVAGVSLLMSPTAFFQTNVRAAEILVRLVTAAVPQQSHVIDLYAGSGLFAIPLAAAGQNVVAIEENRLAVADGEAALKLNAAAHGRCRFIPRRVEHALSSLGPADAVVLDPPREGCGRGVIEDVFCRVKPATAIYVSCNPEALAHDLRSIRAAGYVVASLQPVDMFPHTAHIETVTVLKRYTSP